MSLSYWTYGFLFLSLAILAKPILQIIGSNAEFVPAGMWGLLGLGFLFERYGAHHIQLYSATNKIIWHIANGITGILFIITSIVAFPLLGVYSFPIGYIIGYAGFYSWYSAINSYKTFKMKFLKFEPYSLWIALMIVLAQFVFAYF